MAEILNPDICVVGAGSAGLTVAAGASQMGAATVLIEKGRMGGDCLNYGCVPSKSLLAAGHAANALRHAARFGINGGRPEVDFAAVHNHVHDVIAAIEPNDSVERFEGLGAHVIRSAGAFTCPAEIAAGGFRIRARRFVIATGSTPFVPPIPGLDDTPYFTNETIFDNTTAPGHLVVIGGGPIGAELAQAHRRLGCAVTILEALRLLPKDDPELADVVRTRLRADGIRVLEESEVVRVERRGSGVGVAFRRGEQDDWIEGSHLLVAVGRRPSVEDLGLEQAGIEFSRNGIRVDARLRTTNRRVFALGDVAGSFQFTHLATYHAGIVIRNALFRLPTKVDYRALPWVTFTDPELASVGLGELEARAHRRDIRVLRWSFAENDRAQAERQIDGLIKVVTTRRGRILGAAIVGAHAGEIVQPWVLAIAQGLGIGAMAKFIAPYPTLGEVSKRVAGSYFAPALFGPRTKKLVRLLARLG